MATGAEDALVHHQHHHHQHQQHNRHHHNHHHPQQQHGGSNPSWWSVSVSEDNLSASFTTNNSGLSLAESGELGQRSELVESSPSSAAAAAASFHANMEGTHSAAAACVSAVPDNQLWNQVLMNVGSGCSDGGNLYQMMSSRTLRAPLMDGTENHHHQHQHQHQHSGFVKTEEVQDSSSPWGLSSLGSSGLQLHAEDDMGLSISSLDKPLDMDLNPLSLRYSNAFSCNVADWSLGPPVAQHDSNPQPQRPAMAAAAPASSFNPCLDFPLINSDRAKHECGGGSSALSFVADNSTTHMTLNGIPLLQGIKAESSCRSNNPGFQNQEHHPVILEGSPTKLFRSVYSGSILGATEDYGPIKFQHSNTLRHGTVLTKPVDYNGSYKPFLRTQPQLSSSSSSQTRTVGNQSRESSSEAMKKRNNGDGSGSSQDSVFKRPRFENSSSSTTSYKSQVPKVKLGDRITALQQLVSPFGKTDTASVLWDAISYIKYLHEQVQALSNPYMKAGGSQADQNCWGESYSSSSSSSKDASREPKLDLKSRGLCLVPVSCTLQVSGDMTPDYWQHTLGGSFR